MEFFISRRFFLVSLFLLLSSCASERTVVSAEKQTVNKDDLTARFASNFSASSKDGYGASSDLRSEFESKTFSSGGNQQGINKKNFATNALDVNKQWDGKKGFATSSFVDAGKENFATSRTYETSSSGSGGKVFSDRNKEVATRSAGISRDSWGQSSKQVDKFDNSRIANTPNLEYPISSYRDYARKTIEETNAMLGRKVQNN